MSLAARVLEAGGIATVILGSARDIVEHCGVPRLVFTDFPLGNPVGKPYDRPMQGEIVDLGLDLLESARWPRTTVTTGFEWGEDSWRASYLEVNDDNRAELARQGDERRAQRAEDRREGRIRS